jgi:hypothetical protein
MAPLTQPETQAINDTQAIIRSQIAELQRAQVRCGDYIRNNDFSPAFEFAKKSFLDAQSVMSHCQALMGQLAIHIPTSLEHTIEPGPLGESSKDEL